MVLLLGNLDALVPAMQLLVHGHRLFDLIVLDEDSFGFVELLVEHGELGLHAEVVDALLGDKLVDLAQIVSLGDIAEGSIAALGYVEVLLFQGHLRHGLPIGLGFRRELEGL